ncbi:MAG: hypothetical protein AAF621_00595 [Pseudomonadota bacterium]
MTEDQFNTLFNLLNDSKKTDYSMVLKWVAAIVSGVFITISTAALFWVVSGISENEKNIIVLKTQIEATNVTMNRVADNIRELQSSFRAFSKTERFDKSDHIEALKNYHESKVEPIIRNIDRIQKEQDAREGDFDSIEKRLRALEH